MIKHAIIQAGGEGTRLRPVTYEIPKPLIPVQGVPVATWLIRLFIKHGVERVTVIHNPKWKSAFENWAEDAKSEMRNANGGLHIFEEKEPMGTMGAIVHELELGADPVFVSNGDELKNLDLHGFTQFHQNCRIANPKHEATIALVSVSNPSEYGVAEMNQHLISRFHEKPANPPTNLISSGLYIIEPSIFSELFPKDAGPRTPDLGRFLMFEKDLFPRLAGEGRLGGCPLQGQWYDCGTMERWERAINEWDWGT
ncbi:MAG: nucleotidyltransferase family protein [Patescibacteria group bacterium]|nr:nucleotidyltransferase family protein [Patescibacteria group bacterium]MBU2509495.1 nucleotidyltransferase family protein [Patescibacteria group bacterium]